MKKWKELEFVNQNEFDIIVDRYKNNDSAHDLNHIKQVINNAKLICNKLNYKYNRVIEIACLLHDAGANTNNRDIHHKYASFIFSSMFRYHRFGLTNEEGKLVKDCIFNHRSKTFIENQSIEIKIVSMADKGLPYTTEKEIIDNLYNRSKQFHLDLGEDEKTAKTNAKKHMLEKYGKNGYIKYPQEYLNIFKKELTIQHKLIEKLFNN